MEPQAFVATATMIVVALVSILTSIVLGWRLQSRRNRNLSKNIVLNPIRGADRTDKSRVGTSFFNFFGWKVFGAVQVQNATKMAEKKVE